MQKRSNKKRLLGGALFGVFMLGFVSVGLFGFSHRADAYIETAIAAGEAAAAASESACPTSGANPGVCPGTGIKENLRTVGKKIVGPTLRVVLLQALLDTVQFILDRLAYEAAIIVASGGVGQDSLFYEKSAAEAFGELGLDVAGEALGQLNEITNGYLGIGFDLCSPGPLFNFALAIGIKQKYQPEEPKCDILEVGKNWDNYTSNIYQTLTDPSKADEAIRKKFAETLKPGKNELSASLRLNVAVDHQVHEAKMTNFFERTEKEYKDVIDFVTGNVQTPSGTLQKKFEEEITTAEKEKRDVSINNAIENSDLLVGIFTSTASTFVNTLLSQLIQKIYDGLFAVDPVEINLNVGDFEATAGSGGREGAEARFAGLLSASPISTTSFDALAEFVVCPAEGIVNRGLNNCVMDPDFFAAVSRGSTGSSLTVQEAIDEGFLNGDWPLISPEDKTANQDPFCFEFGFCYGNLVKLRKARVIPIGWELAALRADTTNPPTLQEVIDGFHDCTDLGTVGPASSDNDTSKWCHLIDPDWVLKYPETQCRALVHGEVRIGSLTNGRYGSCADAPSCIGENNDGECVDGYGYCVREQNVWRFRGDECPAQYASCMALENTESGENQAFLLNTVEYSSCDQDNAGCMWYRTNKYFNDGGTEDDTSDDTYEWLPEGVEYITADREAVWEYETSSSALSSRSTFGEYASFASYESASEKQVYSHEDRIYFTHEAVECDEDDAGCARLYEIQGDVYLNHLQNPSFEDDEDGDSFPDNWIDTNLGTVTLDTSGNAFYGDSFLSVGAGGGVMQRLGISANSFYTLSVYAKAETPGSGARAVTQIGLYDENGVEVDLSGTSSDGDCSWSSSLSLYQISEELEEDEFERFECTFTTTSDVVSARVFTLASSDTVQYDGVQLELGEDANTYTEGYFDDPIAAYYKVAPDYLGCTGSASDPEECDNYAQMCSAQDVGCSLYTPEDGDPSVPAIISELDECPSECVGYTTYKQEATDYDDEEFPLYFIADAASACSEQHVGCDAYTNLSSAEEGGEEVEYFTELRACLTEDMSDDTASNKTPATFFTWEGSDNEGYQLQTWYLLESNASAGTLTHTFSGEQDTAQHLAPCVKWNVTSEDEIVCADNSTNPDTGNTYLEDLVEDNSDCDEHDDIFDNPDCREFFDSAGNIHYREHSLTISVDNECTPYRKDESSQSDCEGSGGYWTTQGFCRYFALPEESTECPAAQAGCRLYTGGAGRNSTTILDENFEGGTYDEFEAVTVTVAPGLSVSNESVATDGHSLRVTAVSGYAGFSTLHEFFNGTNATETFDEDSSTVCTTYGHDLNSDGDECAVDLDGDGEGDDECVFEDGDASCGSLVNDLDEGKTFVVEFWAKGSSDLLVGFAADGGSGDIYDLVDASGTVASVNDMEPLSLDGSWEVYSLGPLDTSDLENFDENSVLTFILDGTTGSEEMYIDNIVLKQVEENIAIIKDSWVVPATCDTSPAGVESDQYYLGCEAYSDQDGNDVNIYQFSDICEEDVVGCDAFYHSHNSDSEYQQIYNARCVYDTDGDVSDGETAPQNLDCEVDGETYCTISSGRSYCTFDAEVTFSSPPPRDTTAGFGIVYGPETVIVPGDQPVYIVATDDDECSVAGMGCQEVGLPTFSQDQEEVTEFTSAYYINLPSSYENILCDDEALFCEEWEHGTTGNWYFKDPQNKTCEYKTGITIDGQTYYGWFQTDTSNPCYFSDDDDDDTWDSDSEDAYLIAGEEFGVWNNGDVDSSLVAGGYDSWVASCASSYDLCTEFIDIVDTGGGLNEDGQSYHIVNDELLDEDNLAATARCEGQVSQKFGCAVLDNSTNSDKTYNASASYVVSTHADIFYNKEPNDLVDPIDCELDEGGVFELSEADQAEIGVDSDEIDVCERRCRYTVDSGDSIDTSMTDAGSLATRFWERSCVVDSDCPDLETVLGETAEGTCEDIATDNLRLENDANEVLKVNRDRSCAAWLSCSSSRTSWNTATSKYESICDSIDLCVEGGQRGDTTTCTEWSDSDAVILTDYLYSQRDVNWTGHEYSGLSIPNQLPVEHYNQFDLNPTQHCVSSTSGSVLTNDNGYEYSCSQASECPTNASDTCNVNADCTSGDCDEDSNLCFNICTDDDVEEDYRLVYNAGPCDSDQEDGVGEGGSCAIGYCQSSPSDACSADSDCIDEDCVIGWCQATGVSGYDDDSNPSCSSDNDCSGVVDSAGVSTPVCDTIQSICVDVLTSDESEREGCVDSSSCSGSSAQECITANTTAAGSCFKNRCLTDIRDHDGNGFADDINEDDLLIEECRGYPEVDSPFPKKVISDWQRFAADDDGDGDPDSTTDYSRTVVGTNDDGEPDTDIDPWSTPYNFVSGYQDAIVCSPDEDGNPNNDCLCNYDKVEYGEGTQYRYYEIGSTASGLVMEGVCAAGDKKGWPCDQDTDCDGSQAGTGSCVKSSRIDSLYGWEGYCVEKDTSIQLHNSAQEHDQACLTWLPVDQLAGATDLYGKYTEAGFPLENTYYCAETAYYADLWTLGVFFEADGSVDNATYACASSETGSWANCQYGEYNGCQKYAWCPKGWVALVGYCDADFDDSADESVGDNNGHTCKLPASGSSTSDQQKDSFYIGQNGAAGKDNCPYLCVPENSYHSEGEDKGTSCDADIEGEWGEPAVTGNLAGLSGGGDESAGSGTNVFGTKWVKVGQLSDWDDSGSETQNVRAKFKDCVARGVPYEMGNDDDDPYDLTWYLEMDEYNEFGYGAKYATEAGVTSEPWGAYGIAHRPGNAKIRSCSNTGKICSSDDDCIFTDSAAFCASMCNGNPFYAECLGICAITTWSSLVGTCDDMFVSVDAPHDSASFWPYMGCHEIVQATTNDPDDANKAWTNRLWEDYSSPYSTQDPDGTFTDGLGDFEFAAADTPEPAGALLFEDHFAESTDDEYWIINEWGDKDSWPLPVAGCDTVADNAGNTGLSTAAWGTLSGCHNGQWEYPSEVQWIDDVASSAESIWVSGEPFAMGWSYENIDEEDEYEDDDDIIDEAAGDADAYDDALRFYGNSCNSDDDCGDGIEAGQTSVTGLLSQLFAKVYKKFVYDWDYDANDEYDPDDEYGTNDDGGGHGAYYLVNDDLEFDVSSGESGVGTDIDSFGSTNANQFPDEDERAPVIVSVGECVGTDCYEGTEDAFTVNEVDQGLIIGEGQKHIDVSFYVYAAPNQLPLRNIITDWGDSYSYDGTGSPAWPTTSQSGSTADDNFYKNHRGLNTAGDKICEEEDEWGETNASCSSSYVSFSHDYTCTAGRVNDLESAGRRCVVDEEGRLTNSPCTGNGGGSSDNINGADGSCVYQPRVFAIDNWEWCTGFCDLDSDDGGDGSEACYGKNSECEFDFCPGNTGCIDQTESATINPWVYFNGYVVVNPE